MRQRHITWTMVLEVLRSGSMARPPEPDMRRPGLRCEMRRFVAGLNVAVVVHVDHPAPGLVVVTVIDIDGD